MIVSEELPNNDRRAAQAAGPAYGLWLHSPDLAEPAQQIGSYFRREPGLPRKAVEMVILITARHWECAYEWVAHEPVAQKEGLDEIVIEDIRRRQQPAFADEGPRALHDFARSVLDTCDVSDATISAVETHFGTRGIVETSILIGHYVHGAILARAAALSPPLTHLALSVRLLGLQGRDKWDFRAMFDLTLTSTTGPMRTSHRGFSPPSHAARSRQRSSLLDASCRRHGCGAWRGRRGTRGTGSAITPSRTLRPSAYRTMRRWRARSG